MKPGSSPAFYTLARILIKLRLFSGKERLLRFLFCPAREGVANKRRSTEELREIDGSLNDFASFSELNYMTGVDVARRIGVRDMTLYSWLQGESRPSRPDRIAAFLKSITAESGSDLAPNGYEYRECKNLARYTEATPGSVL